MIIIKGTSMIRRPRSPPMTALDLIIIFVVVCVVVLIRQKHPDVPQFVLYVGGITPTVLIAGFRLWKLSSLGRRDRAGAGH